MRIPHSSGLTEDLRPHFVSRLASCVNSVSVNIVKFIHDKIMAHKGIVYFSVDCISISLHCDCSSDLSKQVDVICASLRVWTSLLYSEEDILQWEKLKATADANQSQFMELSNIGGSEMTVEMSELVDFLFDLINLGGFHVGKFDIVDEVDVRLIREMSAGCVLSLLNLRAVGHGLPVDRWRDLGLTLLDEDASVRRNLFSILANVIQTSVVHVRFLAYPCLLASDDAIGGLAERALTFALQRLRSTHNQLCRRAMEDDDEELQQLAGENMPEMVLPYVLYLLSNHPEFPLNSMIESEDDKHRMKNIVESLKMIINILLQSLQTESDSLSFLLKQVNTILRYYRDKLDPANVGLQFIARVTVKLLTERIRTSENVQNSPGEINLPMDLYEAVEDTGFSRDSAVMKNMDKAEKVINRVLQATGKSKRKLGSPPGGGPGSRRAVAVSPAVKNRRQAKSQVQTKKSSKSRDEYASQSENESEGRDEAEVEYDDKPATRQKIPEEPVSNRPVRKSRQSINYVEPIESERETLKWEHLAEKQEESRRLSKERRSLESKMTVDEETEADGDEDDDIDDHDSQKLPSRKRPQKDKSTAEKDKAKDTANKVKRQRVSVGNMCVSQRFDEDDDGVVLSNGTSTSACTSSSLFTVSTGSEVILLNFGFLWP